MLLKKRRLMPIDKKNYPANWPTIAARILARAEYACEGCGAKRYTVGYRTGEKRHLVPLIVGETYAEANDLRRRMQVTMNRKLIVVRLTTAHLDHNEWQHDVDDDRLACFCEKCHLDHDRVDNMNRKRYGKQYKREQLSLEI